MQKSRRKMLGGPQRAASDAGVEDGTGVAKHRCLEQPSGIQKPLPTFSDAPALVRRELWTQPGSDTSASGPKLIEIPRSATNALIGAACYAT